MTNGRDPFLPESSSVLRKTRRYRDVFDALVSDLGGNDFLSEAQIQMCRTAATMALQREHWDAAAAAGETIDWDLYGRLAGHLRRIFEVLGIERKQRVVSSQVVEHFRRPPERLVP